MRLTISFIWFVCLALDNFLGLLLWPNVNKKTIGRFLSEQDSSRFKQVFQDF